MEDLSNHDPISLFCSWLDEAKSCDLIEPNAMALATANGEGMPSVRMVLLKEVNKNGFVFYTNLESRKARELHNNPQAGLCFHWKPLKRQVRVCGAIESISSDEANAYFASRSRGSRIGAWASKQSQEMIDPRLLDNRLALYAAKYPRGEVPRPEFWSGFRLVPTEIEFWCEGNHRLHDRKMFHRTGETWRGISLFP